MDDYTPCDPSDNLLGIKTLAELYAAEGKGFLEVYQILLKKIPLSTPISPELVQLIHKTALGHVYPWAGKWRDSIVSVGMLVEIPYYNIPTRMVNWSNDLAVLLQLHTDNEGAISTEMLVKVIAWAHYEFICIHPFKDGNGRTARVVTDILLFSYGYREIDLYTREDGLQRRAYISSLQNADKGNLQELENLIMTKLYAQLSL